MMSERSNVNVTMESVFHFDEDEYFLFAIVRLFVCVVFVKIFYFSIELEISTFQMLYKNIEE